MKLPKEIARQREADAWALRQKGWTQAAIGKQLGISQTGVLRALRRAEARCLKQMADRIAGVKATQHAQLEHVIMEAMLGWERSKLDAKTVKVVEDGEASRVERTTRTGPGNPQFLSEARGAMADVRKLWGIAEEGPDAEDDTVPILKDREPDSGLSPEVEAMRKTYLAFGGEPAEFQSLCGTAEAIGQLGSQAHAGELRRLIGPFLRSALRGGR